jgi:hypothetical protein
LLQAGHEPSGLDRRQPGERIEGRRVLAPRTGLSLLYRHDMPRPWNDMQHAITSFRHFAFHAMPQSIIARPRAIRHAPTKCLDIRRSPPGKPISAARRGLCGDQGVDGRNYENQNDGSDQTICCGGSVRLMIQHAPASLVGAEVGNFVRPLCGGDPDRPSARKLPFFSASPPLPAALSGYDEWSVSRLTIHDWRRPRDGRPLANIRGWLCA